MTTFSSERGCRFFVLYRFRLFPLPDFVPKSVGPYPLVFENFLPIINMGTEDNLPGSIEVREYSRFLYLMKWLMYKTLHVYADEIGDIGFVSKTSKSAM